MLYNLNPGHTLSGGDIGTRGINGLKEEVLTRQLVGEIDKELRNRGHSTNICRVDYASTLQESLNKQVALCNSVNSDLNICIHFNTTVGGYGSEVYTYGGKYLVEADRVLKQLNNLGFRNRGIKEQPLALIKRTKAKTIYIEVCFIDSSGDVAILNKYGMNGIAKAIVNGVLGTSSNITPSKPSTDNNGWTNLDGKTGTINTPSGVNVREKKSTSSKILGTLVNGAKVRLYRKEGDWIHIYYPPHGGYIYEKYIKY
ncbi:N-acetylmuramoyl-L-alanine amidase [Clostridium botulinum]|nr:N-acetylmuramoyl-L-alanine amidase [Clostridium botulinum]